MITITFYSYKGGVGRSLALVNAASRLAQDSRKIRNVFVLDLDLEAPGLHFKLLGSDVDANEFQRRDTAVYERLGDGFVEIAKRFFEADVPPLEPYVIPIEQQRGWKGQVHLLPAGRAMSNSYWKSLSEISWQKLFDDALGEGIHLFLTLKERIEEEFKPDVLLVDARTGITEVGGAALTVLADSVVCLFSHNHESVWGAREVLRSISRAPRLASQRPLTIIPVLTRLPEVDSEIEIRDKIQAYFSEAAPGEEPLRLPPLLVLHSYRALEEKEQILLGQTSSGEALRGEEHVLRRDYFELFKAVGLDDLDLMEERTLLQEANAATQKGELAEAEGKWRALLDRVRDRQGDNEEGAYPQALLGLARILRRQGQHEEAVLHLNALVEAAAADSPWRQSALHELAVAYAAAGRFDRAPQAREAALTGYDHLGDAKAACELLSEVKRAYEEREGGILDRSYQDVIVDLGRRLMEARDPNAEAILEEAVASLERFGDEGRLAWLDLRRIRARLWIAKDRAGDAMIELASLEAEVRALAGPKDPRVEGLAKELAEARTRVVSALDTALSVKRRAKSKSPRDIKPPSREEVPAPRGRLVRGGKDTQTIAVTLRIVTPTLGGAVWPRAVDEVDILRVPSLRGQLRFWWRALHAGHLSGRELYLRERALWGGAADGDGGRSAVEVWVTDIAPGPIDSSEIQAYGHSPTVGAYALWPARATRGRAPQETAPRRREGTRFTVHVRTTLEDQPEVQAALRAWILFGGYGGRVRRGTGSVTVEGNEDQRALWLPAAPTRQALSERFGQDILEPIVGRAMDDVALLGGAGLRVGAVTKDPIAAWTTALHWLRDFRQAQPPAGTMGHHDPKYPRERGDLQRPGRSNWPEADKVRRLSGPSTPWTHSPHHNDRPVWPRAGFGLPILAQFQRRDRGRPGNRYPPPGEPEDFQLVWRDSEKALHERLASPLIVKALPLATGQFVPAALWLYRGYPKGGKVILQPKSDPRSANSAADFDELVAPKDIARFAVLAAAQREPPGLRLRAAFFEWLRSKPEVRTVSP